MKLISPNQNRGSNLADLASNTSLQCFAARETTVPTKKTENGTSMTKTKIERECKDHAQTHDHQWCYRLLGTP